MAIEQGSLPFWMLSFSWMCCMGSAPWVALSHDIPGVVALMLVVYTLALIDWNFLAANKANRELMYAHGISDTYIYLIILFNYFVALGIMLPMKWLFMDGIDVCSVDLKLPVKVFLSITVADFFFTPCHKYMLHTWFPKLHMMHHCIVKPTPVTTFIGEPLDILVLEFVPMLIGILTFVIGCLKDPVLLFWTFTCLYVKVIMDHDENFKFPHYFHHKNTSGNYSFFIPRLDVKLGSQAPHKGETLRPLLHSSRAAQSATHATEDPTLRRSTEPKKCE